MLFGDGENDIEMLHLVGTSIAMGNADVEVKKHASTVTLTVDKDGIADFFEKEFKNQMRIRKNKFSRNKF